MFHSQILCLPCRGFLSQGSQSHQSGFPVGPPDHFEGSESTACGPAARPRIPEMIHRHFIGTFTVFFSGGIYFYICICTDTSTRIHLYTYAQIHICTYTHIDIDIDIDVDIRY